MSIGAEHGFYGALLGDPEIAALFSADADALRFVAFEAALAEALGAVGLVDQALGAEAAEAIRAFQPDPATLAEGTATDGLPVPAFVRSLKAALPERLHPAIHTGATSQDLIDTSTSLALKATVDLLQTRLAAVGQAIKALETAHGETPLTGRTRMQAALPIKVADRLDAWYRPLPGLATRLREIEGAMAIQLGGPVGTGEVYDERLSALQTRMGDALGLRAGSCWHSDRQIIGDAGAVFSSLTGAMGKIGQDAALMAQQGLDEIRIGGGGSSSAMPHKANPIQAELLVTLARFNAGMLGTLHQSLVHEQERSGAAWTLEWLVLPQMAVAAGRALAVTEAMLTAVERMGRAN